MNKETIKQIILAAQEMIPKITLVERPFSFEPHACQVLVGIRRAGKSFLLYQYIQQLLRQGHSIEEVLFVNFEDERILDMTVSDLYLLLEAYRELYAHRPIIFLDEIQNIEGWEHFARRLADEKYQVMITGSNARMLSRDIASTLGGRYLLKEVFPFGFKEYLDYRQVTLGSHWDLSPQRADIVRMMSEYLHGGGLSESFGLIDKRGWKQALYERILLSDIVVRHRIRNERSLRLLVRKLAESVMQPTSIKRLQNILQVDGTKISRETIADYLAISTTLISPSPSPTTQTVCRSARRSESTIFTTMDCCRSSSPIQTQNYWKISLHCICTSDMAKNFSITTKT